MDSVIDLSNISPPNNGEKHAVDVIYEVELNNCQNAHITISLNVCYHGKNEFIWPHPTINCTAIDHGLIFPGSSSTEFDLNEGERIRIKEEVTRLPFPQLIFNNNGKDDKIVNRRRRKHKKSKSSQVKKIINYPLNGSQRITYEISTKEMKAIEQRISYEHNMLDPINELYLNPNWMNKEMLVNCFKTSIFSSQSSNRKMSELILAQSSLASAVNLSIRCFWPKEILSTHYIPPSLMKVNYSHIVPYYQFFHLFWKSLEPKEDLKFVEKFKKSFSSYISLANKKVRDSHRNEKRQVERSKDGPINFKSLETMEEMKKRCSTLVLSSTSNPDQLISQILTKSSEAKWLSMMVNSSKKSTFFPDIELNNLLTELLSRSRSLWSAVRNVALVFWSREYLKTHYVPCPNTRFSSRSPVEGASVFHDFWHYLVPHKEFDKDYKFNLRKINQSLNVKKKNE